jgi:hypothetical protein
MRRAVLRRILNGQRLFATIAAVIGIPTAIASAYASYLSFRPELDMAAQWTKASPNAPGIKEPVFVYTNTGAHPLYHIIAGCVRVFGPDVQAPSAKTEGEPPRPVLPAGATAAGIISQCSAVGSAAAASTTAMEPDALIVIICYRDVIPLHLGYGVFGFDFDHSVKQFLNSTKYKELRGNMEATAPESCSTLMG